MHIHDMEFFTSVFCLYVKDKSIKKTNGVWQFVLHKLGVGKAIRELLRTYFRNI